MSSNNYAQAVEESFELLVKCMMQSKHRLIEIGSELGLTGMQAMMVLLLDEPRPMNSFTKTLNCDASNITGLVDGLERKNLAARFPSNKDRRIKMIKLSDKGLNLRNKMMDYLVNRQSSVLFNLDPQELNTLVLLLRKITVKAS